LLSFAPSAKIESIRFRSIPFATPTDAVPDPVDEESKEKNMNREKRRAAAWRAEQDKLESGDKAEIESADKAKSFIDAKGKRKVAFIKKDVSEPLHCD
jgi:nucleolar protein 12